MRASAPIHVAGHDHLVSAARPQPHRAGLAAPGQVDDIVAGAAVEHVLARGRGEPVGAGAAKCGIVSSSPVQPIGAASAVE